MTERPICEDDLQSFVDGRLDAKASARVQAWLDQNPDHSKRLADYSDDRLRLRSALSSIADEPIPVRLNVAHLVAGRRRWRPTWHLQGLAAALLLGVGGAGGWMIRGPMEAPRAGIASLAQEARENYLVYASDRERPVEMGSNARAELAEWGSDRLRRRIAVPDLSAAGYRYLGGRLVPTPHGPAVMAMYSGETGQRVVMLIRTMAVDRNRTMAGAEERGVGAVTWSRDGLGYSLVGPLGVKSLRPIAEDARVQLTGGV